MTARVCHLPLWVGRFKTRCVLDHAHDGPCKSYAQVLKLDLPTTKEKPGA